jgi:myosin heavy subunit
MPDNDDDLVVNIDDLDTVQVNVDDNPKLAQEPEHIKKEQKKAPIKRVSPVDDQQVVKTGPTHEEALQQAQAYSKTQEEARRAAEATAANERSMREQAQREAAEAQRIANQHKERAENSELAVIDNGIAAATQQVESLQEEFTRAAEAGEFAKMGQIQTKISKAAAALDRLENAKSTFEVRQTQTTEGAVTAPTIQQSPFEKYLSGFSPTAQNWLRQHPDCAPAAVGGSQSKNSLMMAGHYAALAKNLQEGTTEYFKEIENHIAPPVQEAIPTVQSGVTSKAAEVVAAGETPRKAAVPSAPVSRDSTNVGAPRNVREVRLTKDQQEMAKVSFPHLPESQAYGQYARNLIELEAEGKIGRMTH